MRPDNNTMALLVLLTLFTSCFKPPETGDLVITDVQVVNVLDQDQPDELMDVLIESGRIKRITPAGELSYASDLLLVDGSGKYLIPGLWDMHTHPDDPEMWRMNPIDTEKDKLLTLLVIHGVTGTRDMAGDLSLVHRWRQMIAEGQLIGPEIFAGGPLIDGPNPMWDGSIGINGPGAVKSVVDSLIDAGVDFLKVYSLLPGDIYLELQRYANEINFPVVGHVPFDITPTQATNAGMKSQEHFLEILKEVSTEEGNLRKGTITYPTENRLDRYVYRNQLMLDTYSEEKANRLFQLMAEKQSWHTPTISMWFKNAWFETEIKQDTLLYKYLPPYMRRYWQIGVNDHLQNRDPRIIAVKKDLLEAYRRILLAMYEHGVPLMTGTDMGANPLCFPGIGVHNELEMFVEVGIPEIDALAAATINPCIFLGIAEDYGSVEEQKVADLVLIDANPLENINAVREISGVVRKGNFYGREELDQMLLTIEQEFRE